MSEYTSMHKYLVHKNRITITPKKMMNSQTIFKSPLTTNKNYIVKIKISTSQWKYCPQIINN